MLSNGITRVNKPKAPKAKVPQEVLDVWGDQKFKLTREQVASAAGFSRQGLMILVREYYAFQKRRKASQAQRGAIKRRTAISTDQNAGLLEVLGQWSDKIEKEVAKGLAAYVEGNRIGRWLTSMDGIGSIGAACMLAYFDFDRCCCRSYKGVEQDKIPKKHREVCPGVPYPGHFISYAGQCPPQKYVWNKGQVRPYNLALKTVFFNIGTCLEKRAPRFRLHGMSVRDIADRLLEEHRLICEEEGTTPTLTRDQAIAQADDEAENHEKKLAEMTAETGYYVREFYQARLEYERRNEAGENAEFARQKYLSGTGTPLMRKTWKSGKIQAAGVRYRAFRHVSQLLINHFFEVGKEVLHGVPVGTIKPFAMTLEGHSRYIPPPNWPVD